MLYFLSYCQRINTQFIYYINLIHYHRFYSYTEQFDAGLYLDGLLGKKYRLNAERAGEV